MGTREKHRLVACVTHCALTRNPADAQPAEPRRSGPITPFLESFPCLASGIPLCLDSPVTILVAPFKSSLLVPPHVSDFSVSLYCSVFTPLVSRSSFMTDNSQIHTLTRIYPKSRLTYPTSVGISIVMLIDILDLTYLKLN